jgi:hypothetical protein
MIDFGKNQEYKSDYYLIKDGGLYPLTLKDSKYELFEEIQGFKMGCIRLVAGFNEETFKPIEHDLNTLNGCILEKWGHSGVNFKIYSVELFTAGTIFIKHGGFFKDIQPLKDLI